MTAWLLLQALVVVLALIALGLEVARVSWRSRARLPAGIWQFIPATARRCGLTPPTSWPRRRR